MARLWAAIGWKRLLVTALCLAAWRALEDVPVAGLNPNLIAARLQGLDLSSPIRAIGSGPPFAPYSIALMGITPYIYALIVMALIEGISARVHAVASTPKGRLRLQRWTRVLAVALALGQAYGWTSLMESDYALPPMAWFPRLLVVLELTAGTVILVLLADVIDEFGLGFGNGAFLIYVLTPVGVEAHRLAYAFTSAPSVDALYRPVGIWLVFSVGIVAATVAVLLAVRRVKGSADLKILMSGVIRPPVFAQTLLLLPVYYANYIAVSNPGLAPAIAQYLTPYGPNRWTDFAFVVVDAGLVIGFTFFVVAIDFRWRSLAPELRAHFARLAVIGGAFLALTVVVLPILEWNATLAGGRATAMSGFDAVLVAAIILAIVGRLEAVTQTGRGLLIQMSRLP